MQELLERKKGLHRKVLIVDDEFIEREMLGVMLQDLFEIGYAGNGREALEIIDRDKLTLSLVLLDLHMPEVDGYSVLETMRSDGELRRIPVIVLTSEKDAEIKSLQLGAADFITKPYDVPDVVRARVQHAIELAEDSVVDALHALRRTFAVSHDILGCVHHLASVLVLRCVGQCLDVGRVGFLIHVFSDRGGIVDGRQLPV